MNTIKFHRGGGPVSVKISAGYAQPGAYTLIVWEANSNAIVLQKKGNFINAEDDVYFLPTPVDVNQGRIVDCLVTVVITPPIRDYAISLELNQDGKKLHDERVAGQTDDPHLSARLFVKLEGE